MAGDYTEANGNSTNQRGRDPSKFRTVDTSLTLFLPAIHH